jgi:hypothetical protein
MAMFTKANKKLNLSDDSGCVPRLMLSTTKSRSDVNTTQTTNGNQNATITKSWSVA